MRVKWTPRKGKAGLGTDKSKRLNEIALLSGLEFVVFSPGKEHHFRIDVS